jgi:hypothetical protein
MTVHQLKSELAKLKEVLDPETSQYHLIRYNSHCREGDKIPLKAFLKIDRKDVTLLNDIEKKRMISNLDALLYLPEKDPLPIVE